MIENEFNSAAALRDGSGPGQGRIGLLRADP